MTIEAPAIEPRAVAIRPLRDDDALDVIELISGVFGEYAGCITDVDGEIPELRRLASYYAELGGMGWVAERGDHVVGTIGYSITEQGGERVCELRKLYVHRRERGSGLASSLVDRVESAARERGATVVELWSDTRFTRAHRFYEKRGYEKGTTRELRDLSASVEHYFRRRLCT